MLWIKRYKIEWPGIMGLVRYFGDIGLKKREHSRNWPAQKNMQWFSKFSTPGQHYISTFNS
ncbi:hypothetical protein MuYL_2722 [Mucilaginibacter xinganensis]|uniref:Uncharacterized protein n=1 Tax=Mucilaginibacter xinganensis TaxID=1234841 RepID=A0A223NXJ8_9SPHI|nr:hypothetical protein MuYL_2722 [Mucilaginibacter xinganensis]